MDSLGSPRFAGRPRPAFSLRKSLLKALRFKNESAAYATIYYKFEKGYKWHKGVLQIGETLALSYAYDGTSQKSPPCLIKIDVNTNGRHIVEYSLAKGVSPSEGNFGNHYAIRQIPGTHTRFLEATGNKGRVEVTDKDGFIPTTVN